MAQVPLAESSPKRVVARHPTVMITVDEVVRKLWSVRYVLPEASTYAIAGAFLANLGKGSGKITTAMLDQRIKELVGAVEKIEKTTGKGANEIGYLFCYKEVAELFVQDPPKLAGIFGTIATAAGRNVSWAFSSIRAEGSKIANLFVKYPELFAQIADFAKEYSGDVFYNMKNDHVARMFISGRGPRSRNSIELATARVVKFEKASAALEGWAGATILFEDSRFDMQWLGSAQFSGFYETMKKLQGISGKIEREVERLVKGSGYEGDRGPWYVSDCFFKEVQKQRPSAAGINWQAVLEGVSSSVDAKVHAIREMKKKNISSLDSLPAASRYSGKNTSVVYQGEGKIMPSSSNEDGMYSFAAENCAIVVVVSKAKDGSIMKIGMGHIDPGMDDHEVSRFFREAYVAKQHTQISVISGAVLNAARIVEISKKYGNLKFMNCDMSGTRDDAVVVDKNGVVYYGSIKQLEDRNRMEGIDATRARISGKPGIEITGL